MTEINTSTGGIESDLDRTRSRLDNHLSQLQDRLSPGQVLDDLMGYFRGSEGAEFGRSLLDSVRGNPLPAAITTVGLAWLMASSPRGRASADPAGCAPAPARMPIYGHDDHAATMARLEAVHGSTARDVDEDDQLYSERLDTARGQALGLARHSDETTASFAERVRHAMSSIQDTIAGKAHDLRDRAGNAANAAASLGSSTRGAVQDTASYLGGALSSGGRSAGQAGGGLVAAVTESPVILGALGLAAGALLGALLPRSEQEEAALGAIAGKARETVRNLASEGMERGSRVAQAVADTAKSGLHAEGIAGEKSPGQLVDAALSGDLAASAKQVAGDVLRAGENAVRKEGSLQE